MSLLPPSAWRPSARCSPSSERGVIVGMGSFLGSIGSDADGGMYSYRAAKAGVHAIMKAASIDLREQGTIAIAMHPGWVATDMGGENAQIQPSESVAGMMQGDRRAYSTGQRPPADLQRWGTALVARHPGTGRRSIRGRIAAPLDCQPRPA
jgi:NAD(P)-dependent dehydrogenase (short-subunit alcohol dehydrogenase family)